MPISLMSAFALLGVGIGLWFRPPAIAAASAIVIGPLWLSAIPAGATMSVIFALVLATLTCLQGGYLVGAVFAHR